jgi:hypothetical protein
LNGVTRAVKDPRNFVFAAMDFSLSGAAKPLLFSSQFSHS